MIMTIEEKAKRYDKAIEIAKEINNEQRAQPFNVMTRVFPELKESEDEKIRKELVQFFEEKDEEDFEEWIPKAKVLAWLEKQGEQKPVPKFKIGDTMRTLQEAKDGWTDGMPFVVSIDSEYYNCNSEKIAIKDQDKYEYPPMNRKHDVCNSCDEKASCVNPCPTKLIEEQNPADKVEPKFHEGDIIIHKELGGDYIHNPHKIIQVDILDKKYRLEGGLVAHFGEQEDYELVEQKQEWSESDKEMHAAVLQLITDSEKENGWNCVYCNDKEIYFSDIIAWLKSLRPQSQWKPSDEPKFHKGEWVVSPNGVYWHIDAINNNRYEVSSSDGIRADWPLNTNLYHLWTIQDAKDGDVLVCKGNIKYSNGIKYERICLFNNLDNAFFTLTKTSNFVEEYDIDVNIDYPDNTVPATKEQKEILFMAMADAGYTFDFAKRELKKIKQKPAEWRKEQFEKDYTNLCKGIATVKGLAVAMTYNKGVADTKEQMMEKAIETTFNVSLPPDLYYKLWIKGCKKGDKLLVIKKDEL